MALLLDTIAAFERLHKTATRNLTKAAGFDESKHPRAANGEFGSGGGGASTVSHPELDPKIQAWVSESWGKQGTELRAAANIAAGRSTTTGIPADLHRSVTEPDASTVAAFKTVQQQTAKAWDAKYPQGKPLLRGISGHETALLADVGIGSTVGVLQPLLSTTDDHGTARDFAHMDDTSPGVIRFIGVRGAHVFSSHEMSPHNFEEFDDQRETIMLGTGSWKLTGKRRDRDGVMHFEFSPVADAPKTPKAPKPADATAIPEPPASGDIYVAANSALAARTTKQKRAIKASLEAIYPPLAEGKKSALITPWHDALYVRVKAALARHDARKG